MADNSFEKIYRGYVIKEKYGDYFIGPTSEMYRVIPRSLAARFTKDEAMEYIRNGTFCKNSGKNIIEDVWEGRNK